MSTFTGEKVGDVWKMDVKAMYKVISSGVQNVLFQVCPNVMPTEQVRWRRRRRRSSRRRRRRRR